MSRQCSSEILSCIGKNDGEPGNIFKLALLVYHGLDRSLGVFGLPEWVLAPPVPVVCHLAVPTIPFQSSWPLLLWLIGFWLQCILESLALAQAVHQYESFNMGFTCHPQVLSCLFSGLICQSVSLSPGGYPLFDVLGSV